MSAASPVRGLADRYIRESADATRNVYLYALLDADGQLLYVGQSANVAQRVAGHRQTQPWAGEIDRHAIIGGPFERAEAVAHERLTINEYQPIYNVYCTGRELPPRGRHALTA